MTEAPGRFPRGETPETPRIRSPLSGSAWISIDSVSDALCAAEELANTEMPRIELIERLTQAQQHPNREDVEFAVKALLERIREALAHGERIGIRGFGSCSVRRRRSRVGRNPRTGAPIALPERHVPHLRPGKDLRERVSSNAEVMSLRGLARACEGL